MVDIINGGVLGSATITVNQESVSNAIALGPLPLINSLSFAGKTCLLCCILILCIIQAQPIMFQNKGGSVLLINHEVLDKRAEWWCLEMMFSCSLMQICRKSCISQILINTTNLQVLLILLPRSKIKSGSFRMLGTPK